MKRSDAPIDSTAVVSGSKSIALGSAVESSPSNSVVMLKILR
jgi:hypothetical protein